MRSLRRAAIFAGMVLVWFIFANQIFSPEKAPGQLSDPPWLLGYVAVCVGAAYVMKWLCEWWAR